MTEITAPFLTLQVPVIRTGAAPRLRRWLAVFAACAVFYMVVVGTKPLAIREATAAAVDGDPVRQVVYLGAFALLVLGAQPHRNIHRLLVMPWSMALMLLWCVASLRWAWFPDIGGRRLLLTAALTWSMLRITDELGFTRSVQLLRVLLVLALIGNFAAVMLSPAAIHQVGERADPNLVGNWRGFLAHKNYTGVLCAMTVLFLLFGGHHWRGWLRWPLLLATVTFLVQTHSKTSINMLPVAIGAGWAFKRYRPAYRMLLVPLVMVLGSVASLLIVLRWDDIVSPIFGSDREAFTGRVEIWAALLHFAGDHLWRGAGFGSFWGVGPDGPIHQYATSWVADLGSGHNGYLDLVVTIGIPGLVLVLMAMILLPLARLLASTTIPRDAGALLAAILAFAFGHNLTESTLVQRDEILQLFLVIAIGLIGVWERSARRARPRRRAATPASSPPPTAAMET